jgi:hypothetical protein
VLLGDHGRISVGDGFLETPEMRLDRADEATVLVVLACGS